MTHMDELELVKQDEVFSWLPEEGLETLGACFDLTVEHLAPGEMRNSAGRGGYLLHGGGVLKQESGSKVLRPGSLLGIRVTARGEKRAEHMEITATEACTVLWFNFELLRMVCYAACWFHVRFLKEIENLLAQ